MSRNPILVSNAAKGFGPLAPVRPSRASRSRFPAHTLQQMGFRGSAPRTRPTQIRATATRASIVMSVGSDGEMGSVVVDEEAEEKAEEVAA